MPYSERTADIEERKKKALQEYGATSARTRRNQLAKLQKEQEDYDKWGWLRGGSKGAGAGALTGAALGSIVPGLGTGLGALIGGGLGALGGGALGAASPEAEAALGDVTGAARTIGGVAAMTPKDRLLNMLDAQSVANTTGTNYGADMSQGYTAELPEDFKFSEPTGGASLEEEMNRRRQRGMG